MAASLDKPFKTDPLSFEDVLNGGHGLWTEGDDKPAHLDDDANV
jgi:hypothetical protein